MLLLFNTTNVSLVSSSHNHKSYLSGITSFLCEDIDISQSHFQLIALGFATGMVEVVSYKDFSVYTSMQTGNLVIFSLFIMGASSVSISSLCASVFGFLVSACISGHLTHLVGHHRRWWLMLSCFFQTFLVFLVVIFLYEGIILTTDEDAYVLVLLLAISFGIQVSMTRVLSCPEIPTIVLTLTFVDCLMDRNIFKRQNLARNRRIFYLIFFIGGMVIGSVAFIRVNRQLPLIMLGIVKSLTTLSFLFVRKARPRPSSLP